MRVLGIGRLRLMDNGLIVQLLVVEIFVLELVLSYVVSEKKKNIQLGLIQKDGGIVLYFVLGYTNSSRAQS